MKADNKTEAQRWWWFASSWKWFLRSLSLEMRFLGLQQGDSSQNGATQHKLHLKKDLIKLLCRKPQEQVGVESWEGQGKESSHLTRLVINTNLFSTKGEEKMAQKKYQFDSQRNYTKLQTFTNYDIKLGIILTGHAFPPLGGFQNFLGWLLMLLCGEQGQDRDSTGWLVFSYSWVPSYFCLLSFLWKANILNYTKAVISSNFQIINKCFHNKNLPLSRY